MLIKDMRVVACPLFFLYIETALCTAIQNWCRSFY